MVARGCSGRYTRVVTLLCASTAASVLPSEGPTGWPSTEGKAAARADTAFSRCMPITMSVMLRSRTTLVMAFTMFTS